MNGLTYAANRASVRRSTLVELFFEAVDQHGSRAAFQRMSSAETLVDITYREAYDTARQVAAALDRRGLRRGDRVAILSENRPEWALTDYGCLVAGVIVVPIYATLPAQQIRGLLEDSGVRVLFASNQAQVVKAREAAAEAGLELEVVAFDPPAELPVGVVAWSAFLGAGRPAAAAMGEEEFRRAALVAGPDDVATILYTSGTTGTPKGVMLTHDNIASNVRAARLAFRIDDTDNTISFLPLSHILQRMVDYLFFWVGCRIAYPRSLETLVADLRVIRPTVMVSVPRTYEKIYNGIMSAGGVKRTIVSWAVHVADRTVAWRLRGEEVRGALALEYRLADRLVFRKVRAALGGRLRFFVSGGGPLSPELARFFYSIGLTILEGYGLTETSPVTNVNTEDEFRIGTVGKPVASTEVRIAPDGEILVRGRQVMKGYYGKPLETAAAIDPDGWFATGDIGSMDAEGFLTITDRKKDLIVTAGGKNVAPQPIENRLLTNPFVEQAVLLGDRRKYIVLLVVPAFGALEAWAGARGIRWDRRAQLLEDPRVVAHMEAETLGMLGDVARFERPKRIALLPEELTIENGFLTPTLKVKRREVERRYAEVIDALYAEEPVDAVES